MCITKTEAASKTNSVPELKHEVSEEEKVKSGLMKQKQKREMEDLTECHFEDEETSPEEWNPNFEGVLEDPSKFEFRTEDSHCNSETRIGDPSTLESPSEVSNSDSEERVEDLSNLESPPKESHCNFEARLKDPWISESSREESNSHSEARLEDPSNLEFESPSEESNSNSEARLEDLLNLESPPEEWDGNSEARPEDLWNSESPPEESNSDSETPLEDPSILEIDSNSETEIQDPWNVEFVAVDEAAQSQAVQPRAASKGAQKDPNSNISPTDFARPHKMSHKVDVGNAFALLEAVTSNANFGVSPEPQAGDSPSRRLDFPPPPTFEIPTRPASTVRGFSARSPRDSRMRENGYPPERPTATGYSPPLGSGDTVAQISDQMLRAAYARELQPRAEYRLKLEAQRGNLQEVPTGSPMPAIDFQSQPMGNVAQLQQQTRHTWEPAPPIDYQPAQEPQMGRPPSRTYPGVPIRPTLPESSPRGFQMQSRNQWEEPQRQMGYAREPPTGLQRSGGAFEMQPAEDHAMEDRLRQWNQRSRQQQEQRLRQWQEQLRQQEEQLVEQRLLLQERERKLKLREKEGDPETRRKWEEYEVKDTQLEASRERSKIFKQYLNWSSLLNCASTVAASAAFAYILVKPR